MQKVSTSMLSTSITIDPEEVVGVLTADKGGTGFSSYTVGDITYSSSPTVLTKLNAVATGNALISGGIATAPLWGKIGLTTHVAGVLPVANGGTGESTIGAAMIALGALGVTSSDLTLGTSGFIKFANGFMIQWGKYTSATDSYTSVTYDEPFTLGSVAVCSGARPIGSAQENAPGVTSCSATGFSSYNASDTSVDTFWIAVGV